MSFFARLKALFGAKAHQAMEAMEDRRASLIEVSTARRSLEGQRGQTQKAIDKAEEQARQAIRASREDLATRALERKGLAQERLNRLNDSIASLEPQVESLKTSQVNLRQKIELFQ